MKFFADIGNGGILTIENVEQQTIITLTTQAIGQQQSQQMSLSLGKWTASPTLFKIPTCLILQIDAGGRQSFARLQHNSISLLSQMPSLIGAEIVPLRNAPATSAPMPKMEPMRMGNMEMRMEPMEMRMGNMRLRMETSTQSTTKFCSQCGEKVKEDDQFCSNCGAKLKA